MDKIKIFLFLIALSGVFSFVSAGSIIGASPGEIEFKNVLRGGYAERYLIISTDSSSFLDIDLEARGEIKSWLNFSADSVSVSKDQFGRLIVSVTPPSDVPNGNYTGFVRVSLLQTDQVNRENRATGTIKAVIDVSVTVEITDLEVYLCNAGSFSVQSVEKGDEILFETKIINNGNIRIKPEFIAKVWDQNKLVLIKELSYKSQEIYPTKEDSARFKFSSEQLELGQYWVEVSVPDCLASETLTFDVLERGALKAEGILLNLFTKVWAEVGETVPIVALFKNTGQKNVIAQFKGQIVKDGKIVQIIETEKTDVLVNEMVNFTYFFTPKNDGKYIASGRVFYDKKRTFEASTVLNVLKSNSLLKTVFFALMYILIFVIVIYLIRKIRKERETYNRFWRAR